MKTTNKTSIGLIATVVAMIFLSSRKAGCPSRIILRATTLSLRLTVRLLSFSSVSLKLSSEAALSDPQRYNVFDRSFSSPLAQELLPPMPAARSGASLDPTSIHPSRSAPPSCSSSPLAPGTSTDYLDVPTRMDGSTSREHSPAKSDNDPGDARRRLPCLMEGCSRRFTNQYTLRVHMDAHKPKPKQTFPCTLGCSEKFSRQHDRLRHEVSKHGKVCEFLCDACGRFFSSRKTLGNHKCPVAHGTTRWMDD
ncbi:hypothetical protein AX15_000989 [Amanita polypyramis BW_CC]|nr:hypothetical protein AX15_000989 [Amanita polypyramis BW_CC]